MGVAIRTMVEDLIAVGVLTAPVAVCMSTVCPVAFTLTR